MSKQKYKPMMADYRELIDFAEKKYGNLKAYKYKKDHTAKEPEYIEKTYTQTVKDIKGFATALLSFKEKPSKVVIIGENRYEWVVGYFGVSTADIIVAPMDKLLPENEIKSLLSRCEAEAIIFEEKNLEVMKSIKSELKTLKTLICMDKVSDTEVEYFWDLVEKGNNLRDNGDDSYDKVTIDTSKTNILLFTSGTTDKSKIVMLSQANICSNIHAYQTHFLMKTSDTLLSILPIHHTFESSITIIYGFYSGVTVAFCDGLRYIAQNMKEYHVSILVAVPLLLETMYKKINKGIADKKKTGLINKLIKISNSLLKAHIDVRRLLFKSIIDNFGGELRIILYGAAKLDKETIIGFNNFGIDSIQGYGLTETSPVVVAESEKKHCPGSAGYALDNLEVKIYKPDFSGVGEVLVKGPSVFLGYYKDEEKTREAFEGEYFKTGDYGYLNEDGFLFITGRKKDIIVLRNGKNVYPEELELLVNRIPYVKESMVFSREKDKTDTVLMAKIVYDKEQMEEKYPKKDEKFYKDIIWKDIKEINKGLENFKHIKKIIITDEPMSKTTTQKVKRYEELKKIK